MTNSTCTACRKDRYVKLSYLLILIGAATHVFEGVFIQAGYAIMSLAPFANIFIFIGLVMALLGFSVFRRCMDEKQLRRFKYILMIFVTVFVVYGALAYLL